MASLPIGRGGPWAAGQALMQRDSPKSWDKMVRLYRACGTQATELCEAAIILRTMPPLMRDETKGSPAVPSGRAFDLEPNRSVGAVSRLPHVR
jgi:hypothetical protein